MKKLLATIGILALAAALLPAQGYADLRGAFGPLTIASGFIYGTEQPAFRPVDAGGVMIIPSGDGPGRFIEEWFSFSTRTSLIPGHESVRSIYLHLTSQQSAYFAPLKRDPAGDVSYFDPAWSADGRFLAYVQTNFDGSNQAIYIQEYYVADDFEAVYGPGLGADSPIGTPILVTTAGSPQHPDWSLYGHTLAWDSNVAGSLDIYTADIDVTTGTVSTPVRRTFVNNKAETSPTWSPNGQDIAYVTNKFGPRVLEIINLGLSPADPAYARLAEHNFGPVSHNNPDYSSDGGSMLYDAPSGEDPSAVTSVWKLDLTTKGKCEIQFDGRGDADPSVSGIVNFADGGVPFNYFIMTSQGGNFGVHIWKVNTAHSCLLPLAMGVATVPPVIDLNDTQSTSFMTVMNFPPETRELGYRCQSTNEGTTDGVRLRVSILASPTLLGMTSTVGGGVQGTGCFDSTAHALADSFRIRCNWDRRMIAARIQALGLVGAIVPLKMTAYSNRLGRRFQGFSYLRVMQSTTPGPVALLGSSPNPFNPVTRIKFVVYKPGNYALRLYNVQGALVRTVVTASHFEVGTHEATWDGRTNAGAMAASGIYYAKIADARSKNSDSEGIKLVLAK